MPWRNTRQAFIPARASPPVEGPPLSWLRFRGQEAGQHRPHGPMIALTEAAAGRTLDNVRTPLVASAASAS